jgi:hypothetical protein
VPFLDGLHSLEALRSVHLAQPKTVEWLLPAAVLVSWCTAYVGLGFIFSMQKPIACTTLSQETGNRVPS